MTNRDLIARIRKSVADYQANRIGRGELLSSLDLNSSALEGLSLVESKELRISLSKLESSILLLDEDVFKKDNFIHELETWLDSLSL
jgi:hypothetical protein